jgi:hypothetical protein
VGKIRDLEVQIRDYINHYRNNHVLVQDLVKWNILCSSLDVVGDTELAIEDYKHLDGGQGDGFNYLAVYGILQVIYVQQDAVRHILESLDVPLKLIDPGLLKDTLYVRSIRNKATGHPSKHGKGKQPLSSHFISRISLSLAGFTLMSAEGARTQFNNISISDLLQKQEAGTTHALEIVVEELRKREEAHKMKFKGKTMVSMFPSTLGYYFEKVYEGTLGKSGGRWQFGGMHVGILIELVAKLREAFTERAVLPANDPTECALVDTEYALGKLKGYYDSASENYLNDKDAYIFTTYVESQFEQLKTLAAETDEDLALP